MIEVIHFPNPICTVKFSSPVVQSATARGTRWNASPLPKRTAIIPNMVNCRFPLPLRIIYRFYCGRFCIKCFPCLCVPLSDIKAVQGDSGHAQVNMVTDAYSHISDDDQRKNAELFEEAFYEKKIWIHRCMYSRKIIILLLLMKSIRNFWQKYWRIQRCGRCSIHWRKR